jgi:glutamine synthetase type III
VSAYNKGKLVNLILEQTLVPTWVLNADIYQKAINTQADLMMNSASDKVRCDAANSLLTHLKKPEAAGPLINLDLRETSGMNELKDMLRQVASRQQAAIESGVSTADIAAQPIIEGEAINRGIGEAEPG